MRDYYESRPYDKGKKQKLRARMGETLASVTNSQLNNNHRKRPGSGLPRQQSESDVVETCLGWPTKARR